MKAEGTAGEIREFECANCRSRHRRYFSHFEKPEVFTVIECQDCGGQAWLLPVYTNQVLIMKAARA